MGKVLGLVFLLASDAAVAEEAPDHQFIKPLSMEDFTLRSEVEFFMPFLFSKDTVDGVHFTAYSLSPLLAAEWAWSWGSVGLSVPWNWTHIDLSMDTEEGELTDSVGSTVFGNLALHLKLRHFMSPRMRSCVGFALDVSSGLQAVERVWGWNNRSGFSNDDIGHFFGMVAHQGILHHAADHLVLRATFAYTGGDADDFYQFELSGNIQVPVFNTDYWRRVCGESVEFGVSIALGAGFRVFEFLIPAAELRLDVPTTEVYLLGEDLAAWLNIGARFDLGRFQPMVRLAIPLSPSARFNPNGFELQFGVGLSVRY